MARKKTAEAAAAEAAAPAPLPAPLGPPPPVGRFELVSRARICLSRTNPRKYFDPARMAELEASVREHGIIVPLIVRPWTPGVALLNRTETRDLELVAGERRFTAAGKVGLDEVPVVVQDLTDEQAFDVQLLENGQRADIHPLEEADAFAHKRNHFHRSIEEIAQQTGKTPLYVTTRLKLTELCDAARKAFLEGKVASAAIALLIARIPDEKLQRDALKSITEYGGEGMTYRQARDHVQREFMLELGKAPFSIARADLVPEAGACTSCPKRTGNQRELFEDVDSKDVCTDPACYRDKVDAEWKARVAAAKAQDIEVMPVAEAKKLLPYEHSSLGGYSSNEYADLDSECYDDTAPRRRTYRQLLAGKGKAKREVKPDVLVRHPHTGAIIEAVKKKGLEKRLREAGHDFKAERKAKQSEAQGIVDHDTAKWKEERARQEREQAIDDKLGTLVLEEAASAVRGMARESFDFWKLIVQLAVMVVEDFHDFHEEGFFKRHGIEIDADKDDEATIILAHVATLGSASSVRGFAFELLAGAIPGWGMGRTKLRELLAGHFELDVKELKKRATAAVKEDEKAKAAAAKAAPKKGGKKAAADDDDLGDDEE